jgi:hydrogenase nickel incorporation protein HypA/HybF
MDMHELPVIQSILDICLQHAARHDVKRVLAIHLEVGEMSDLEDQWMQSYFDRVSERTIAEGAELLIKRAPVVMACDTCEERFEVDVKESSAIECPRCRGRDNLTFVSGKEYKIVNLEGI